MPKIPMRNPHTLPGGWQGLFLPGGHEFYEASVYDAEGNFRAGVRIGTGNPRDASYARRFDRYRRRPTRYAPPLPRDASFATLVVAPPPGLEKVYADAPPSHELVLEDFGRRMSFGPVQLSRTETAVHVQGHTGALSVVIELTLSPEPPKTRSADGQTSSGLTEFTVVNARGFYTLNGRSFEDVATGDFCHRVGALPFRRR